METISTKRVINGASREVQARHNCQSCGKSFAAKHTGRKPRYCSDRCRDAHRRQLNFDFCGATRYPCQAKPRNAENSHANSNGCKAGFAGRGPVDKALWRSIIELEVYAGRDWHETISSDGVTSQVATLRPRALREVP